MGLFDSVADALECIEEGEGYRLTEGRSEYRGYQKGLHYAEIWVAVCP